MARRSPQKRTAKLSPKQDGFVRIISGRWRGRKLPVKDVEGLRPTTDRVKETVFNWLAADLYDARCLDVFAGSGGLGFEALSRQAAHVTMLELNPQAAQQLKTNAQALDAEKADVIQTDALTYLQQAGKPVDIVFIDPPFRKDLLIDVFSVLESNGWLAPDARIYIEAESELGSLETPPNWTLHREKTAGQVTYRLYFREEV